MNRRLIVIGIKVLFNIINTSICFRSILNSEVNQIWGFMFIEFLWNLCNLSAICYYKNISKYVFSIYCLYLSVNFLVTCIYGGIIYNTAINNDQYKQVFLYIFITEISTTLLLLILAFLLRKKLQTKPAIVYVSNDDTEDDVYLSLVTL